MRIIEKAISFFGYLLYPPKCCFCGDLLTEKSKEEALCPVCLEKWTTEKNCKCRYCGRKHIDCACAFSYGRRYVDSIVHITGYTSDKSDVSTKLILMNKDKNIERISRFLALETANAIKEKIDYKDAYIVNCPRKIMAIIETGYDQSEKMAREISKILGLKYLPAIRRNLLTKYQKNLGEHERNINSGRAYSFRNKYRTSLYGKKVILIDDVATTGFTFGHCAELLRINGVGHVCCAYVAKTNIVNKTGRENGSK